jgi:hypothetical protein
MAQVFCLLGRLRPHSYAPGNIHDSGTGVQPLDRLARR